MKHIPVPIVIIIASLIFVSCTSSEKSETPTPESSGDQGNGAIISATGIVVPEQWAGLSARSQAVITEVLVSENDLVTSGQLLLVLDGQAAAQAALSTAKYELISAQLSLDTLIENASTESARTQQAVADAMKAVHDAQKDVDRLAYRRASDDLITQTQDEIDLAKKQISKAEDAFKLVKKRPDGDSLKAEAELALVKARIYLDNRTASLNWYTGRPDDIDSAKYLAELAVAQADLARSQSEFDRRKGGPDKRQLKQAEARLALAKSQVQAAEEAVADLEIRAPFDGVICNLDARVGEWVAPGKPILQLGNLDKLQVKTTDLSEIDAARVNPPDLVLVTFDALPELVVNGSILRVGNKSAEGSGVNYTAIILLDNIPAGLRWGMTAFVDIKVSQ